MRTLGTFALGDAHGALRLGPGKPLALLTYVSALPGRVTTREHLLAALWADLDEARAKHVLRQTVYSLRRLLGHDAIVAGAGTVAIPVRLESDRDTFIAAIDAGRHREAFDAYGGDFLAEFAVPGALGFEHWADAERQRLRIFFIRTAEALARAELKQGHFRIAQRYAARMRDVAPLDETAWRLLLETAVAGGDRVTALSEAQRLDEMLAADGREPEASTTSLLRRARSGSADTENPEASNLSPELTGREREFGALVAAFKRARKGAAGRIDVSAPAGLGKTRLLRDFARHLASEGRSAVLARAHPSDATLEWSYAADVARQLSRLPGAIGVSPGGVSSLVALDPTLSAQWPVISADQSAGDEAFRRRLAALEELLRAVSDERTLAVLLDDMHWADEVSFRLLQRLAERTENARVLFVFSHRPMSRVAAPDPSVSLTLAPLSPAQIEDFAASLGAIPDDLQSIDLGGRLHTATGGSPLLLLETLQLAVDVGALALRDRSWSCDSPEALFELLEASDALARRIARLGSLERRLLVLLAAVGGPAKLSVITDAIGESAEVAFASLAALERAGLATHAGGAWLSAHDEIAAHALDSATPGERASAHAAVGHATQTRATDTSAMRTAARHFRAAGLQTELVALAKRWIHTVRRAGDSRHVRHMVADLLGVLPGAPDVADVLSALPWHTRLSRGRAVGFGAVFVLVLAAVSGGFMVSAAASVASVSVGTWQHEADGGWRLYSRDITARDMLSGVVKLATFRRTAATSADRPEGWIRPGTSDVIAATKTFADSGGLDVILVAPSATRRLTTERGDDVVGGWSPDGRYLVIQTDRWSSRSMSDIAILDPDQPNSIIRRLTFASDTRNTFPLWSPDGTHIAFWRRTLGARARHQIDEAICVVPVRGGDESCVTVPGYTATNFLGWAGPTEVVGNFTDSTATAVVLGVNTSGSGFRRIAEGQASLQSHAAGWVTCYCRRSIAEPYQTLVIDLNHTDRPVRIEPGDPPAPLMLFTAPEVAAYLDRLSIVGAGAEVPVDGTYQLRISGRDSRNNPVTPFAVDWTSRDTSIAVVTVTGLVQPRRSGHVTVVASAGGWRTDSAVVTIGPAESINVVTEKWTSDYAQRWAPFGDPRPVLVRASNGVALAPNGDSTFTSGVYLRQLIPASGGLGIELEVSAPITMDFWQTLVVRFVPRDSSDLSLWDHRTGYLPIPDQPWRVCQVDLPQGAKNDQLQVFAGISRLLPMPSGGANGKWMRIRAQLFPDGRCGIAVNGRALAILDRSVPIGDSARLVIDGYSYHARILVGRVAVWQGVRRDVDWSVVEHPGR